MLADREPVFEANLKKVKPATGETRAEVEEYFQDKYERLNDPPPRKVDTKISQARVYCHYRRNLMTKTRRTYTREFKLEAVHLVDTSGKSAAQSERELGIGIAVTRHWTIPARRPMSNSSANRSGPLRNTLSTKPGEGHLRPLRAWRGVEA